MYLPDDRHASVVAFVEGVSIGQGDDPLEGFQPWLLGETKYPSPLHWSAVIHRRVAPGTPFGELTEEQERLATEYLLDSLAHYLDGEPAGRPEATQLES